MGGFVQHRWLKLTKSLCLAGVLVGLSACSKQEAGTSAQLLDNSPVDSRIINGSEVSPTDPIAASTVQVYILEEDGHIKGSCSGTLIAADLVLTAAHCAEMEDGSRPTLAVVFSNKMPTSSEDFNAWGKLVIRAQVNEKYNQTQNPKLGTFDIAMLKVEGNAPTGWKPVEVSQDVNLLKVGLKVTAAGYGQTAAGAKGSMPKSLNKWDAQVDGFASGTQLAVLQKNGGICHGDSGGPLYATVDGKIQLVAVTNAFAHPGEKDKSKFLDDCKGVGIYTSTAAMKAWIESTKQSLDGTPARSIASVQGSAAN